MVAISSPGPELAVAPVAAPDHSAMSDPRLSEFLEAVRASNPFRSNRVTSVPPATSDSGILPIAEEADPSFDVKDIHAAQFRTLCEATEAAARARVSHGCGMMLMGGAGVGKSHLLSRLCQWAQTERKAWFVYLHNVMASPAKMPRHFLRSVVSALVEGRTSYEECPLYRMLNRAVKNALRRRQQPIEVDATTARNAFFALVAEAPLRFDTVNRSVFEVLYRFFESVNLDAGRTGRTSDLVHNMVDWLSGDAISREAAKRLGIAPCGENDDDSTDSVRLDDVHQIEQALLALCGLARLSDRALLVCLDQFDNLDVDQVRSLSRFLHALLDRAPSLVLVTAGVSDSLLAFQNPQVGAISTAQWDRLAQQEVALPLCTPAQARDLIAVRLAPLRKRFADVPALRPVFAADPLYPLSEKEFELRFGELTEVRPRSALAWAGDAWERLRRGLEEKGAAALMADASDPQPAPPPPRLETDVIDEAVRRALEGLIADRLQQPGALPADADNLATLVERLLGAFLGRGGRPPGKVVRSTVKGRSSGWQLELVDDTVGEGEPARTAIVFVTAQHGTAAAGSLRRLLQSKDDGLRRRILVTDDERAALPRTPKVIEYLEDLKRLGDAFVPVGLSFRHCAELDALRSVIDQSRDLTIEHPPGSDRPLTRDEVIESLDRQGRLDGHPLLSMLLGGKPAAVASPPVVPRTNMAPAEPVLRAMVEASILDALGWRVSVATEPLASDLLRRSDFGGLSPHTAHALVRSVAEDLGERGAALVKPLGDGLLVMACL